VVLGTTKPSLLLLLSFSSETKYSRRRCLLESLANKQNILLLNSVLVCCQGNNGAKLAKQNVGYRKIFLKAITSQTQINFATKMENIEHSFLNKDVLV
jgi:hypothetical protein